MNYRKICFIFFVILIVSRLFSDINIINLPVGKSLSLGNDFSVSDNGVLNTITNPAMLCVIKVPYLLEFNRLIYYADTGYNFIGISGGGYAQGAVVGLVIGKFSSGEIKVRDIRGVETGTTAEYSVSSLHLGISARLVPNLWLGGVLYGLWEKINIEKKYFGTDVGFVYIKEFNQNLLRLLRVGSVVKGLGINENLLYSSGLLIGTKPVNIILGYETYINDTKNEKLNTGVEINILGEEYASTNVSFRIGYSGINNEYLKSYGAGLGIKWDWIILNYSLNQHNFLGLTHNIQLSFLL